MSEFKKNISELENAVNEASNMNGDSYSKACYYRDVVFAKWAF